MAPPPFNIDVNTPCPSDRSRSARPGRYHSSSPLIFPLKSHFASFKVSELNNSHISYGANSRRRAISDPTTRQPISTAINQFIISEVSPEQLARPKTSGLAEELSSEQRKFTWFDEPLSDEELSYIPPMMSNIIPRKSKQAQFRVQSVSQSIMSKPTQEGSTSRDFSQKFGTCSTKQRNTAPPDSLKTSQKTTSLPSCSSSQSTTLSTDIPRTRPYRSGSQSSESSTHISDYTFDIGTGLEASQDRDYYFGKPLITNPSEIASIDLSSDGGPPDFTLDIQKYMTTNRHIEKAVCQKEGSGDAVDLIKSSQVDLGQRNVHLEDTEKQLQHVTLELNAYKVELLSLQEKCTVLTKDMKYHENETHEAKTELRRTELELSGLKDDLEAAQTESRETKVSLREVSEELDEVQIELQSKTREAAETDSNLRKVKADLGITKNELLETTNELERSREDLEETEIELEKLKAEVAGLKSDLTNVNVSLKRAKADQLICKQELLNCKESLAEERRTKQIAGNKLEGLVGRTVPIDDSNMESPIETTNFVDCDSNKNASGLQSVTNELNKIQAALALSESNLRVEESKNKALVEEIKSDDVLRKQCIKDMDNLMVETEDLLKERDQLKEDRVAFKSALTMAKKKYEDLELDYKKDVAYYKKEILRMMYERNEAQHFLVRMGANPSYEIYEEFRKAYARTKKEFPPAEKTSNVHIDNVGLAKKTTMAPHPTRSHEHAMILDYEAQRTGSDNCSLPTDDFTVLTVSTFN